MEPFVEQNIRDSADYIKLMAESGEAMGARYTKPLPELQAEVVRSAHRHGLKAVAHATSLGDTLEMLHAGVDGLTHTFYDQAPTPELVAVYEEKNAWLNPTLAATGSLTTEGQTTAEKFAHDPRVAGLLSEKDRKSMCECTNMTAETSKLEYAFESVRQLHKAGVDIIW